MQLKRIRAAIAIAVVMLLVFLPIVLPQGTVSAQSAGYSISQVDHNVEVMFSGQVVIRDVIHISGQITDGFTIGFPSMYSAFVLKAIAFDQNTVYQVNLGVPLGDKSRFYAASVNFNGKTPTEFTVAFVLSNQLTSYIQTQNAYTLGFPTYPSLTQNAGSCNVTLSLPATPTSIGISKVDGQIFTSTYITTNLAAYTYSSALASFQLPSGTLQLSKVSQLNRQITIDPTGKVSSQDKYQVTNNSPITMQSFIMSVPSSASKIVVRDEFGRSLANSVTPSVSDTSIVNATLVTFLTNGQSASITIDYNLPIVSIHGSEYILNDFRLFSAFDYYVDHGVFTFVPPEGATIITPTMSSLDTSSSLTRQTFQDTLTVAKDGISYLDYNSPESNTVKLAYDYNPIWVSFRPTFWASFLVVIGSVGVVFIRRRQPTEKTPTTTKKERSPPKAMESTSTPQQEEPAAPSVAFRITQDSLKDFTDAYEEKKQLNAELKSLDQKAQKGKIPRRQYKVQRQALMNRLETLARTTKKLKDNFRTASGGYADLMKQLDSAEEDLTEADEAIRSLEARQNSGEISLEKYKKNIGDYQKNKEKAESTINGILLRLREKIR
jgi:hypothetical protein